MHALILKLLTNWKHNLLFFLIFHVHRKNSFGFRETCCDQITAAFERLSNQSKEAELKKKDVLLLNVAQALIDNGYIKIRSKHKNTLADIIKNLRPFSIIQDYSQLFKIHLTLAQSLGGLSEHDVDGSENVI